MKVTLLLLLVVSTALAGTVPHRRTLLRLDRIEDIENVSLFGSILDRLKDVLDRLAKVALDAVNDLKGRLDQLMEEWAKKTEELLLEANGNIGDYLEQVKQNLSSYENVVGNCLAPVPAELERIARESYENAKQCHRDFTTRVKISADNVKEHVEFFVGKVQEIQAITEKCLADNSGVKDQVKCVLDHVDETTAIVKEILADSGKLLAETTKEVISLANDTRECYLDVVRLSHHEADKLVTEVLKCIQQNDEPQ